MGTGQKVNEQRLQLSHTKTQDGVLSSASGHPGNWEKGLCPHHKGAVWRRCSRIVGGLCEIRWKALASSWSEFVPIDLFPSPNAWFSLET